MKILQSSKCMPMSHNLKYLCIYPYFRMYMCLPLKARVSNKTVVNVHIWPQVTRSSGIITGNQTLCFIFLKIYTQMIKY